MKKRTLLMSVLALFLPLCGQAAQLNGAGSSFIYPIFSQWASTYYENTGTRINYQAIGSGGGIRQIVQNTIDFAASDAPMSESELAKEALVQLPLIMGGVIPAINVPGIETNQLKLDGETLAAIFAGKITRWNDARIRALNPGLSLPDLAITVVHRADGSGTTWIFTNYLSKVSASWKAEVGNDKSVKWPTGVGAKGNDAVANYVKRIRGGIGYVELAYVLQNDMAAVTLKNQAGHYVSATLDSLKAAAVNADWKGAAGFAVILTDQPGAESWPITGATFLLMHKPLTTEKNRLLRDFFDWAWHQGSEKAEALAYVALPGSLVELIEAEWPAGDGQ